MSDDAAPEPSEPRAPALDPSQPQYLNQRLESEQNLGVAGGAVASLVGAGVCALGNLLAVCATLADQADVPFLAVLERLDLPLTQEIMVASFSPMDLLFYAIAVFYGYKLAFRRVTDRDLERIEGGTSGEPDPR